MNYDNRKMHKTMKPTIEQTRAACKTLSAFINRDQRAVIIQLCNGEEGEHFRAKLCKLAAIVEKMPTTYQTENQAPGEKIAWLHYFTPSADFYIVEKDADTDGEGQIQAWGLADIFQDGGELGYISLPEIFEARFRAELDLYFEPRPMKAIRPDWYADKPETATAAE